MGLRPGELLIDDDTPTDAVVVPGRARGLIPRDYARHPVGCYRSASAFDMPLIPRSEWSNRIEEMEETKSRLSDIRRSSGPGGGPIPSLDQGQVGYCWNHSVTMSVMLLRATMNQPYVRLSAYMIGCLIKNYRDEGGWGALALDFVQDVGVPSVLCWPERSMSRANDTPSMRGNAMLHRVTEGWADLSAAVYDRDMTFDQVMTCLLCRIPVVTDFNWWGHSVCAIDPVEVESVSYGIRILNSWGDGWGDLGEGVLRGSRAVPDGAVAPRVTMASVV